MYRLIYRPLAQYSSRYKIVEASFLISARKSRTREGGDDLPRRTFASGLVGGDSLSEGQNHPG